MFITPHAGLKYPSFPPTEVKLIVAAEAFNPF